MLSTPTRVCIPLNSQRTSSHRTQLWRSGRMICVCTGTTYASGKMPKGKKYFRNAIFIMWGEAGLSRLALRGAMATRIPNLRASELLADDSPHEREKEKCTEDDSVNGERGEAAPTHPAQEPGDYR